MNAQLATAPTLQQSISGFIFRAIYNSTIISIIHNYCYRVGAIPKLSTPEQICPAFSSAPEDSLDWIKLGPDVTFTNSLGSRDLGFRI